MKRFFKKSVALFSLAVALCGSLSFNVARAQQTPPKNITFDSTYIGRSYILTNDIITGGSYHFTYYGSGNWSYNASGQTIKDTDLANSNYFNPKLDVTSVDPNNPGTTYGAEEQAWDAYSNTQGNHASQAQSNANAANAEQGWFYYLKNVGAILSYPVLVAIYYLLQLWLIPVVSFFLTIAGNILDIAINFSVLGTGFSTFHATIQSIWTLARDVCNVFFIFILLYIAIEQIIGQAGSKLKGTLASVVISALFINFSLFFTGLIIDAGNLVATALLNQVTAISQPLPQTTVSSGINALASGVTSLATGGAPAGPQISSRIMNGMGLVTLYQGGDVQSMLSISVSSLIASTLELILFLVTTFVFILMALLILGRFVMLIFLMATAPLGFMGGSGVSFLDEAAKSWRKELINQTLVAPIFAFFILLIVEVSQLINPTSTASIASLGNSDATAAHLVIYFDYVFIIYLLIKAVEITKGFSGEIGKIAGDAAAAFTGAAFGLATGSTAFALRQVVGGKASDIAEKNKHWAHGNEVQRLAFKGLQSTSKASFDVRERGETGQIVGLLKDRGINIAGGQAKAGGKGGYVEEKKKFATEQVNFAKGLTRNLTDDEARAEYFKENPGAKTTYDQAAAERKAQHEGERAKIENIIKGQQEELDRTPDLQKRAELKEKIAANERAIADKVKKFEDQEAEQKKKFNESFKEELNTVRKKHQIEYANMLEKHPFGVIGEALGAIVPGSIPVHTYTSEEFRKAAAKKIRDELVKEKTKEKKLLEAIKENAETAEKKEEPKEEKK